MYYDQVVNMINRAVEIGIAANEARREPANDKLKQREVKKWLKANKIKQSVLDELVEAGQVKKRRMGPAKNSPIVYSKFEIIKALKTKEITNIIND